MNCDIIAGLSSFLFIISFCKSLYLSDLLWWKISNGLLIVSSFLCNSSNNKNYLLFDYLIIYILCTSYINNLIVNIILLGLLYYEFQLTGSIKNIKDLVFILAVSNSVMNTYLYGNKQDFYIILFSFIIGTIIYKIREYINNYYILLTILWHISILNILCISSITAK